MKPTTKPTAEESGEDALANVVMDMLLKGESSRTLIGYDVNLTLAVTPRFVDKTKGGSR